MRGTRRDTTRRDAPSSLGTSKTAPLRAHADVNKKLRVDY